MSNLGFAGEPRFLIERFYAHGGTGTGKSADNPAPMTDVDVIAIPAGTIIEKAAVIVDTIVTGVTVVEVGDDDDADGFVPNASVTLGTVGMYGYSAKVAGAYLRTQTAGAADATDVDVVANAKYYPAAGKEVKVNFTTASEAGALRVLLWGTYLGR